MHTEIKRRIYENVDVENAKKEKKRITCIGVQTFNALLNTGRKI